MAITLDNVTLSQVDFKMLKYDETDISQFREGYDLSFMPQSWQDLPAVQNFSLCNKMFIAGLTSMNLYDDDNNVIGSITAHNYRLVYITAQPFEDYGHYAGVSRQMSTSGYEPYYTDGTTRHYLGGVKYMAYVSMPNNSMYFTVTLNNETMKLSHDSYQGVDVQYITQVDDVYGAWNTTTFNDTIWRGDYLDSIGIVEATFGDVHGMYLTAVSIWPEGYWHPQGEQELFAYQSSTDILADNLSFTEHPIEEDGYVNELLNRFSPRFWTNCVGMYMIPASTGSDRSGIESVMKMLQEFDISDKLVNSWVGTDGKEYIINLRWYFGLNNNAYVKKAVDRVAMQIGPVLPTKVPIVPGEDPTYYYEDVAISEFAVWHTSELFVAPHFDNYLDMLTSYQLYLPYYGFLSLDPNDVVGARLKVYYNINLFTGHCDIIVTTKSARTNNKEEKTYSVSCVVGEDIPFTTEMYQSMGLILGQRIKEAAGVLSSYAKGDMKGMLDAVGLDSSNAKSGKTDAGTDDVDDSSDKTSTLNQVINVANSVLGTTPKPTPTPARSGNFSAETGTLEDLFPYLLVTRPISAAPSNYEEYGGIPSFKTANLGSISGFTKIAAVAPRSITDAPKYINEILSLLQAGVYL